MSEPEASEVGFSRQLLQAILGGEVSEAEFRLAAADLPTLRARRVSDARREAIEQHVEDLIARRAFRVVGAGEDLAVWQRGWSEVAEGLGEAGPVTLAALKPQYFHDNVEVRMAGDYWTPDTPEFEYWTGIAVRRLLMLRAFGDDPARIVELGCGTGMNLIVAAGLFPRAQLMGADWAEASQDIVARIARGLGRPIESARYDMLTGEGAAALRIGPGTDVLTVHALEQLGPAAPATVDHLVAARPRTVLHIEPILEFYDRAWPFDDIAARYHLARGYLQGLMESLAAHAAAGRVEIVDQGRVRLGNLYHEAYSFIAWRPA